MRARSITLVLIAGCWTSSSSSPARGPQPPPGKPDREMLLGLAAMDGAVAAIDPAVGLVLVDHFHAPGEDVPAPRGEQHFCGAALADFMRTSWSPIGDAITQARNTDHVQCSGLECWAGGAGEWDPVLRFYFAGKPGGVWLRGVAIADEVSVPDEKVDAEHLAQQAHVARLAQPCVK